MSDVIIQDAILDHLRGSGAAAVHTETAMAARVGCARLELEDHLERMQTAGLVAECYTRDRRTGAFHPIGWTLTPAGTSV